MAAELERLGCFLIYADKLGHEVLLPGRAAYVPTVEAFGREILKADGTIDRKQLGRIVFQNPGLLAQLTGFIHPAVFKEEQRMMSDFFLREPHGIAVVEAAILIEAGRHKEYDRLIVTACSSHLQLARAMARDHLTEAEVQERLSRQMPLDTKRTFAHFVIETDGTPEETLRQVAQVHAALKDAA